MIILNSDVEGVMRLSRRMLFASLLVLFLAVSFNACSSKKTVPAKDTTAQGDPEALGPVESLDTVVTENDTIMEGRTSGPMLPVYFDFDSAVIRQDQVRRVETNADFLRSNNKVNIRIEGNCDPRGTREYNLALGERRALSAKKYLTNLGVAADRLYTVSWGEEKLLLFGHDELSWAQNRRDDFVIVK